MSIVVDTRECEKTHKLFSDMDGYRKTELPVGDIYIPEHGILVERKTYSDLVGSVYNGRFQKQIHQMSRMEMSCFIMVIGTLRDYQLERFKSKQPKDRWSLEHHYGILASNMRQYPNVHWIFCDNNNQSKLVIQKLIKKFEDKTPQTIYDTDLMRVAQLKITDKKDVCVRMLTGLPGIGVTTARKIIKHAGTLEKLVAMSAKELEDIEDIGEKKAKSIYDFLH